MFYICYNYLLSFTKQKSLLIYFQYIFSDVKNNYIFTTADTGNIHYKYKTPFSAKKIQFHPTNVNYLLGYDDEDDPTKKVRLS